MSKALYIQAINGMFSAKGIGSVTPTEKGVAVTSEDGTLKYWHEQPDKEKAKLIAQHLTKAIMTADSEDPYQADWEALGLA